MGLIYQGHDSTVTTCTSHDGLALEPENAGLKCLQVVWGVAGLLAPVFYIAGFRCLMALLLCHRRLFFLSTPQKSPAVNALIDIIFPHFNNFGTHF